MKTVKCTVVGDPGVGKASLLRTFISGEFPKESEPIIFDTFLTHITVDGKNCQLSLWYTNGMEDFNRFRPLSYPGSNIVLVCFSLEIWTSLDSVSEKWAAEIKEYCPDTPIILVGLKQDLRHRVAQGRTTAYEDTIDPDAAPPNSNDDGTTKESKEKEAKRSALVPTYEGTQLANKLGMLDYIEVSSFSKHNLTTLFEEVVRHSAPSPTVQDSEESKNVLQSCKGCIIL